MKIRFLLFSIAVLSLQQLCAQQKTMVLKGAKVYTIAGKTFDKGVMIIQNGKIVRVGDSTTFFPKDAQVMDLSGKVLMPGLIDTHSHLGGPEGGDGSSPIQPETRALDAINPTSDGFKKALAGGITTLNVMPGSGLLISGQTVYLKMRAGKTIEDILITNEKGVYGGL